MSMFDDLPEIQHGIEGMWAGKIASNPANVNVPVMVTIPAWDDHIKIGPCAWVTRGNSLPVRGQNCLVAFDNNQQAVVIAWWDGTAGTGGLAKTPTRGLDPPSSPVNVDTWIYAGSGFYWLFIYDTSEATYKWKFIGGPPLIAEVQTDQSTASTTYAALGTAGPSIGLPFGGDYRVGIGFQGYNSSGIAWANRMSYDIGGTGAVDADAVISGSNMTTIGQDSAYYARKKTGLGAVALVAKYKVSGGTGNFTNRWMEVTPIRITA